jgi:phospholipid/cholesterol/gamma-HCH transport system ATP-binding protein
MAHSEADLTDPHIALEGVHLSFGDRAVLRGVSCAFPRGRISVILGGSGSGKTTVLRAIAGLVSPQSGRIVVDGEDVARISAAGLSRVRSSIGMLFQGGALLDSLPVFDNLAFPLRERTGLTEPEIARAVHDRLEAVGLHDVDHLLPGQLSGGMLRRAALARAMVMRPKILLCDEPFSGLDPISVKRIELLLARVNRRLGITMLVVSHHIASTVRLADQVLLLLPDRPVIGTPADLRGSTDPEVAGFFDEDLDESLEPDAIPADDDFEHTAPPS